MMVIVGFDLSLQGLHSLLPYDVVNALGIWCVEMINVHILLYMENAMRSLGKV